MVAKIKTLIPLSIKKPILAFLTEGKRYITESRQLYHDIHKINGLIINETLRKKIRRTRIFTFYFKKYDKKNMTANIVGHKVKFNYLKTLQDLFTEIFINGCYWFTTDYKEPIIIDCGSHFGQAAMYFKILYPKAKIICFEPDDYAFSILKTNITTNEIQDIELHNKAIADYDGIIEFYNIKDSKGSVIMSTVKERVPDSETNIIQATRLSNFINSPIDFLKLDIEGAELSVLKELIKSDKLRYVKQMAIEYHHHIKEHVDNFSHTLELLEDADFGYQIESEFLMPRQEVHFQDILIYAYNKNI
ncbi:FkbM family methyltransferase [Candidatus Neomarinimicrobiota bacterium]